MTQHRSMILRFIFATLLLPGFNPSAMADVMDNYQIGSHGTASVKYPAWFKKSLYDLREDLSDARKAGKRGIIVFFSQESCSHCKAFIDTTLNNPMIQSRVQKTYDLVGLDIFNDFELTNIDGTVTTVKDFAETQRARLTPTLIFYGVENARLLKIMGFYPPEKFSRVLDYIEGEHYRRISLRQYIFAQQGTTPDKAQDIAYDYSLFAKPPHRLERTAIKAKRPLLVVFDKPNCKPCRRFHDRVLSDGLVRQWMSKFETVQLNASDNTGKITVTDGRQLSPRQWAEELQLVYDIAVVFFDEAGKEVHRLDAETGRDRMLGSMEYVLEKAYERHEQFLRWRKEQALEKEAKSQPPL